MNVLNSGLIIVGAYDDKIRRTLFGMVKDVDSKELAKAAGNLNRFLFKLLVEELRLDKGDVVRVRVPFEITNGKVSWDLLNMEVEVFKRVAQEDVKRALDRLLSQYRPEEGVVRYEFRPKSETLTGEVIYEVLADGKSVGMARFDGKTLRGAVLEPIPRIFEGRPEQYFEDVLRKGTVVDEKSAKEALSKFGTQ